MGSKREGEGGGGGKKNKEEERRRRRVGYEMCISEREEGGEGKEI